MLRIQTLQVKPKILPLPIIGKDVCKKHRENQSLKKGNDIGQFIILDGFRIEHVQAIDCECKEAD